jgi:hypothetical protein
VRKVRDTNESTPPRYYSSLKFKCTFPWETDFKIDEESRNNTGGLYLSFAYALPYLYTDLLSDLIQTKKLLIAAGGTYL